MNILVPALPRSANHTFAELGVLKSCFTLAEVRLGIKVMYPTTSPGFYDPLKAATTMSDEVAAKMSGLTIGDLLFMMTVCYDGTTRPYVSTFNATAYLAEQGYNLEILGIKPVEMGDTLSVSRSGTPFPEEGKCVQFKSPEGVIVAPCDGPFVSTAFMKLENAQVVPYTGILAQAVSIICMFFEYKTGKHVPIDAAETFSNLLGLTRFTRSLATGKGWISTELDAIIRMASCSDVRGWEEATFYGTDYAHRLYVGMGFYLKKMRGEGLENIARILNLIVSLDGIQFATVRDNQLFISSFNLPLPSALNASGCSIPSKDVTVEQAAAALVLARAYRGQNDREKGAFMHAAYVRLNVHLPLAKVVAMTTNIRRFVDSGDKMKDNEYPELIIYADDRSETANVVNILNSLHVLDYQGIVVVPIKNAPMTSLKESAQKLSYPVKVDNEWKNTCTVVYEYSNAKFLVVVGDPLKYVNPGSWIYTAHDWQRNPLVSPEWYPTRAKVIDIRAMGAYDHAKNKFLAMVKTVENNLEERIKTWQQWKFPVISRCMLIPSVVTRVTTDERLHFYSGCDPHNMVMWVTYGTVPKAEKGWYYEIASNAVLKEVAALTVLANVSRCMRSLTRHEMNEYCDKYGYKIPLMSTRGFGRVNATKVTFEYAELEAKVADGTIDIFEAFENSNVSIKGLMLSNPEFMEKLTSSAPKIVEDEFVKPVTLIVGEGTSTIKVQPTMRAATPSFGDWDEVED